MDTPWYIDPMFICLLIFLFIFFLYGCYLWQEEKYWEDHEDIEEEDTFNEALKKLMNEEERKEKAKGNIYE